MKIRYILVTVADGPGFEDLKRKIDDLAINAWNNTIGTYEHVSELSSEQLMHGLSPSP